MLTCYASGARYSLTECISLPYHAFPEIVNSNTQIEQNAHNPLRCISWLILPQPLSLLSMRYNA